MSGAARALTAVGAAVLLTGCGGSASGEWTDDFCGGAGRWRAELDNAFTRLDVTADAPGAEVDEAVSEVVLSAVSATYDYARQLRELRATGLDDRDRVDRETEALADTLDNHAAKARRLVSRPARSAAEALDRVTALTRELIAAANDVETTAKTIRALDRDGELAQTFDESKDCAVVRRQRF